MKKIILLLMVVLLISGCGKKCVKSHKEQSTCIVTTTRKVGNVYITTPHSFKCSKTICDEYEK